MALLLLLTLLAEPPRLVVIACVDQCRADYLERFEPLLAEDGFRRLLAEGAVFTEARTRHAATNDSPGHAALATGFLPAPAGIPNDHWFERETNKYIGACEDFGAYAVGSDEEVRPGNVSAIRLARPTLGDRMKDQLGEESRVLSFAWRDRCALLLGGQRADGAYWIDRWTGTWVTTSRLRPRLPAWVVEVNEAGGILAYAGETWERSFDVEEGERLAGPDDDPAEPPFASGTTFPYPIPEYALTNKTRKVMEATPFGDRVVLDAVLRALDEEQLGADDVPDLLCVDLDALEFCGLDFGPDSQETMDVFLQADRRLAELMRALDEHVGAGRWTIAITSDHGVAPLPGKSGGLSLKANDLVVPVELGLRERLGPGRWVVGLAPPWMFLAGAEAAEPAAEILAGLPGVSRALTCEAFASESDDVHPTRSGDVWFLLGENTVVNAGVGTNHGSAHDYDRRVPLLLSGAGIRPGVHAAEASPLDVAPTLARLLGIAMPEETDGRVLVEALLPTG